MSIHGHDNHEGKEHCDDCRFWERKDPDDSEGLCLRFPPNVVVLIDDDGTQVLISAYPETMSGHWCGEHSANED